MAASDGFLKDSSPIIMSVEKQINKLSRLMTNFNISLPLSRKLPQSPFQSAGLEW